MSTTSTTFGAMGAITVPAPRAESFFSRAFKGMIAAREAQARRYVNAHLATLADAQLTELGFSAKEIAAVRASAGAAPAPMLWS